MRLVLGGRRSRSLHGPDRILRVCMEALRVFSLLHGPEGLSNTVFSQGCLPEVVPGAEHTS